MIDYFFSLSEILVRAAWEQEPTITNAVKWGCMAGRIANEENQ